MAVLEEEEVIIRAELVAPPAEGKTWRPRRSHGRRRGGRRSGGTWVLIVLGLLGLCVFGCCLFSVLLGGGSAALRQKSMEREMKDLVDEFGREMKAELEKMEEEIETAEGKAEVPPAPPPRPRREPDPDPDAEPARPPWGTRPPEPEPEPEPPPKPSAEFEGRVFLPAFTVDGKSIRAGHAFSIFYKTHRRKLILTAHHLFGPAGGLPADVPAANLAGRLSRYILHDPVDDRVRAEGNDVVTLKGAYAFRRNEKGVHESLGDVAAFWGPAADDLRVFVLANAEPRAGEPVWLVAQTPRRGGGPVRRIKGTVFEPSIFGLYYSLDESVDATGTGGAPVIDKGGAVVGIQVGRVPFRGKTLYLATPVSSILEHLYHGIDKK
jgi:hypothetical protein